MPLKDAAQYLEDIKKLKALIVFHVPDSLKRKYSVCLLDGIAEMVTQFDQRIQEFVAMDANQSLLPADLRVYSSHVIYPNGDFFSYPIYSYLRCEANRLGFAERIQRLCFVLASLCHLQIPWRTIAEQILAIKAFVDLTKTPLAGDHPDIFCGFEFIQAAISRGSIALPYEKLCEALVPNKKSAIDNNDLLVIFNRLEPYLGAPVEFPADKQVLPQSAAQSSDYSIVPLTYARIVHIIQTSTQSELEPRWGYLLKLSLESMYAGCSEKTVDNFTLYFMSDKSEPDLMQRLIDAKARARIASMVIGCFLSSLNMELDFAKVYVLRGKGEDFVFDISEAQRAVIEKRLERSLAITVEQVGQLETQEHAQPAAASVGALVLLKPLVPQVPLDACSSTAGFWGGVTPVELSRQTVGYRVQNGGADSGRAEILSATKPELESLANSFKIAANKVSSGEAIFAVHENPREINALATFGFYLTEAQLKLVKAGLKAEPENGDEPTAKRPKR